MLTAAEVVAAVLISNLPAVSCMTQTLAQLKRDGGGVGGWGVCPVWLHLKQLFGSLCFSLWGNWYLSFNKCVQNNVCLKTSLTLLLTLFLEAKFGAASVIFLPDIAAYLPFRSENSPHRWKRG